MSLSNDFLYSTEFESVVHAFLTAVRKPTTIQELTPIIEQMKRSDILSFLMTDPNNDTAKNCLKTFVASKSNIPYNFITQFLILINTKINIAPNGLGFISQSYNAKVVPGNLQPPTKITNLTVESRMAKLRDDCKKQETYTYVDKSTPPFKLKLHNDLLNKCLNAVGDLHKIIQEGNIANNCEIDEYIAINNNTNCTNTSTLI